MNNTPIKYIRSIITKNKILIIMPVGVNLENISFLSAHVNMYITIICNEHVNYYKLHIKMY